MAQAEQAARLTKAQKRFTLALVAAAGANVAERAAGIGRAAGKTPRAVVLAAMVASTGVAGMAPTEAKANDLVAVAAVAVVGGVVGFFMGKDDQEENVTVTAGKKRSIDLAAGDTVDVVVQYEGGKRRAKRVEVSYLSMSTGEGWVERYKNSPTGMQKLRQRLGEWSQKDVNLQVESHIRYKGLTQHL